MDIFLLRDSTANSFSFKQHLLTSVELRKSSMSICFGLGLIVHLEFGYTCCPVCATSNSWIQLRYHSVGERTSSVFKMCLYVRETILPMHTSLHSVLYPLEQIVTPPLCTVLLGTLYCVHCARLLSTHLVLLLRCQLICQLSICAPYPVPTLYTVFLNKNVLSYDLVILAVGPQLSLWRCEIRSFGQESRSFGAASQGPMWLS